MIQLELTEKIKKYLELQPDERDVQKGAELLLRVTRNKILYANIVRNPVKGAKLLEYHLGRILGRRLSSVTHEQVAEMMVKVEDIEQRRGLVPSERSELQKGKRADHDELPPEVQKLYVENADIMRRMREAHTKLRLINSSNSTCPDSDRFPLAKMLIAYDEQYRRNWNLYDHYVRGTDPAQTVLQTDARTETKNAVKTINLVMGKYAANPSESQADRIRELYAKIPNPSQKLRDKMSELGLA